MFRRVLLAVLLTVPLSCASSGSTNDDGSSAPAATGPHRVGYGVYCSAQCTFEVSYRGAEGMKRAQASTRWSHSFSAESGGQVAVIVRRRDSGQGRLFVSISVNGRTVEMRRLEDGETGPVSLAGEVQ